LARKNTRRSGSLVTIHDVARHAGVLPMTVSRGINSESNVRQQTRARVDAPAPQTKSKTVIPVCVLIRMHHA